MIHSYIACVWSFFPSVIEIRRENQIEQSKTNNVHNERRKKKHWLGIDDLDWTYVANCVRSEGKTGSNVAVVESNYCLEEKG